MAFLLRQPSSGVVIEGDNDGDSIFWNAATREWDVGVPGLAPVQSVFGRTGNVVAQTGDYDSDQVDNVSSVAGTSVSDALETLQAQLPATEFDAGLSGAAKLIDFQTNGKLQVVELDANCTLSLAAVSRAGYYSLRIVNSGAFTLALPAGTRIAGGSYTPTPNGEDFLTFYWPGAGDWRVAATLDFT